MGQNIRRSTTSSGRRDTTRIQPRQWTQECYHNIVMQQNITTNEELPMEPQTTSTKVTAIITADTTSTTNSNKTDTTAADTSATGTSVPTTTSTEAGTTTPTTTEGNTTDTDTMTTTTAPTTAAASTNAFNPNTEDGQM